VVRPVDDVPGEAAVNPEQQAAAAASGSVFVSAGAGTGKTSVLVERFVHAVGEGGLDGESVLAITYTRRAAAELRGRIRAALVTEGRLDLARELDGAWISTIHGFCARLLRAHPLSVGVDPRFRELDEPQAAVLRGEAFATALGRFCADGDEARLELLATYGSNGLRRMLTGVYETLRSAGRELELELGERPSLDAQVDELREAARCLAEDAGATDLQRGSASQALAIVTSGSAPERLLDLGAIRARGERAATFEEARKRVEQAALEQLAERDRELLQELLTAFAAEYAAAKERESALDFEDLQLAARDLLRDDSAVRAGLRFRSIMVDEFQDTNRLQCELVDLVAESADDVFFVGDEFQSIYGFRHADVQVFRERRASSGNLLALSRNYRSRPEVLAVVNELFEPEFGGEFQPLAASGEFPDPVFGHPVELLVTDKASYRDTGEHWRRGEARHVARRVRELVDAGAAAPGEIVLLFAAGTDAEWYEEELRRAGLQTFRGTGRGYFGQQQVVDLLAYLRLLHNRYDDEALVTVLASPFVGVSNDALVLLRRHAGRRPLFSGVERTLPPALSSDDERLLRAFKQRYERLAAASTRLSLERLCEQVVAQHDYDLAILAQWDGRRRYANLRKLARLARSYEELRGPDVQGFVRFVRDQEALGARELEAVAEEEDGEAVRLLTIHAAKGLEFKVVVVADAGRERAPPAADEILALSDGRFGFRVVHPGTGKRQPVFDYETVRADVQEEERAERLRLYYVAMTRAVERLIVAGSVDSEHLDGSTPMGWVLSRLDCAAELDGSAGQPIELERGGARLVVRVDRYAVRVDEPDEPVLVEDDGQLALFAELPAPRPALAGLRLPELAPLPAPPVHEVRRLSYSALSTFEQCSYKYYARYVVGMSERDGSASGDALGATAVGSLVHGVLEGLDLRSPSIPDDLDAQLAAVPAEDAERVRAFVVAYCGSELASRIAALDGACAERPFAFEHDDVLLHGFVDVLHMADGRATVVDYKTNVLGDASPQEIVESEYRLQRLVYALACFRAQVSEVEVVYQFLERPDALVSTVYTREDLPALECELSEAVARIRSGEFVPTPSDFACAGCPALDLVCAGPRLRDGGGARALATVSG
jgi:ATP-dependent helicase/nuclease subunit A